MFTQINQILKEKNIFSHSNEGITIATVESLHEGFALAQEIFYTVVDSKTVLYLSGGSTPKVLYERFATEEKLSPGAVGVVDERYGPKYHEKSNEKMFQETGLLRYLQMRDIPFYPMLIGKSREETAAAYDEQLRKLNATYPKSIAILGVGADGHTSGIAPNRPDFTNPLFEDARKDLLVSEFDDPTGYFKERVTTTFLALEHFDLMIIFAFGPEKKKPLELIFSEGKETEIPARFFTRPNVAKKTLLITDQRI
jgi:6-phosphogluconolactonase/glucosamine-6-phosphate isomerase/deaminase